GDEAERILAVAGAAANDLLAIEKGALELGVARAVGTDRVVDGVAPVNPGLRRRTERAAELGRARGRMLLQRKIATVTEPHTKRLTAIARLGNRAGRRRPRLLLLRCLALKTAAQQVEDVLGTRL